MWKEREKTRFIMHITVGRRIRKGEREKKSLLSVDNSWHTRARVLPIIWKLPFSLLDVVPERRWVEGCWLATRAPSSIFFFPKKNILYILYIRETSFDWKIQNVYINRRWWDRYRGYSIRTSSCRRLNNTKGVLLYMNKKNIYRERKEGLEYESSDRFRQSGQLPLMDELVMVMVVVLLPDFERRHRAGRRSCRMTPGRRQCQQETTPSEWGRTAATGIFPLDDCAVLQQQMEIQISINLSDETRIG